MNWIQDNVYDSIDLSDEEFDMELCMDLDSEEVNEVIVIDVNSRWEPPIESLEITTGPSPKPSVEEAPKLELKPHLKHLKYTYQGPSETLPVIISADLDPTQEG